jgi:CheY-like chemotaxis protein
MREVERIWLIDDDIDDQFLVQRALKLAEIPIVLRAFSDPTEAMHELESFTAEFPDIIICDFKLRATTGLDFLDWLRKSRFAVIPVIIRSNSALRKDVNEAYEHGANCYVQKGIGIEDIQRNLALLLQFWSRMCTPEVHPKKTH